MVELANHTFGIRDFLVLFWFLAIPFFSDSSMSNGRDSGGRLGLGMRVGRNLSANVDLGLDIGMVVGMNADSALNIFSSYCLDIF